MVLCAKMCGHQKERKKSYFCYFYLLNSEHIFQNSKRHLKLFIFFCFADLFKSYTMSYFAADGRSKTNIFIKPKLQISSLISHHIVILIAVLNLPRFQSEKPQTTIRKQSTSACRGVVADKLPSDGRAVIFPKSRTYQGNKRRSAAPEQHPGGRGTIASKMSAFRKISYSHLGRRIRRRRGKTICTFIARWLQ